VRNSRLVYTSDGGSFKDSRRETLGSRASGSASRLPDDGVVRISRDRAGRGGKVVTVIHGLPERGATLEARGSELRRLCGAGGTVKDGTVEIQGNHRDRVAQHLRALGYTVKLAGG
jgi:translation initiation factor 1